jgi:tetratricopeptide (TPR) repeat protein
MEKIKWIEEYINEANNFISTGEYEQALSVLERILYDEPGYARLHYVIGTIYYYEADEVRKGEQHLKLAIHFDETYADPYVDLGRLLSKEERLDEAIEIYLNGLKARQANKSTLFSGAGKAYELKMKYGKAIRHYRKALRYSAELWNCIVLEESINRCQRKRKAK